MFWTITATDNGHNKLPFNFGQKQKTKQSNLGPHMACRPPAVKEQPEIMLNNAFGKLPRVASYLLLLLLPPAALQPMTSKSISMSGHKNQKQKKNVKDKKLRPKKSR